MEKRKYLILFLLAFLYQNVNCRIHQLELEDDARRLVHINSFGFLKGGFLSVFLNQLIVKENTSGKIGFTLDRTLSNGINPYNAHSESNNNCALNKESLDDSIVSSIILEFDFANKKVITKCSKSLSNLQVYANSTMIPAYPDLGPLKRTRKMSFGPIIQRKKRDIPAPAPGDLDLKSQVQDMDNKEKILSSNKPQLIENNKEIGKGSIESVNYNNNGIQSSSINNDENISNPAKKQYVVEPPNSEDNFHDPAAPEFQNPNLMRSSSCESADLRLNLKYVHDGKKLFATEFSVYIANEESEGLYNLYFHNCDGSEITLNLTIKEENQNNNYLSAGEMPLPSLYFMMSILFFITGCFWVFILKKSRKESGVAVYKIHYMMGALVFLKSLSLLFHAINFHYIQLLGTHVEGWAYLFYIIHLIKGALLFITILLIGTGYAFVKHLLSDKDKKIFVIIIPLQVLANIAEIIIEESEEGTQNHTAWKVIFISVDLLCCGAILFPIVWSIKHLQEASQTDGKAASNLKKLKLFRHFYIIIVCYIYFTRIIINMLLRITVPFQYSWIGEMLREMTTFIFFVLTGYKFRPYLTNPYLRLAHDSDDEDETDFAITRSGLTEGLSKRGPNAKKKTLKEIIFDPDSMDDEDEEILLEKRREASHELD